MAPSETDGPEFKVAWPQGLEEPATRTDETTDEDVSRAVNEQRATAWSTDPARRSDETGDPLADDTDVDTTGEHSPGSSPRGVREELPSAHPVGRLRLRLPAVASDTQASSQEPGPEASVEILRRRIAALEAELSRVRARRPQSEIN